VDSCGDGDAQLGEVCLQPPAGYAMGIGPSDIVLGDFDGDGDLDVATSNEDADTVSVRLGNGDGTFGDETVYAAGTGPVALEVGRFDADDVDDLVVVNRDSNDVAILLADGLGGFAAATFQVVGTTPVDVAVGSFDDLDTIDDDVVVLSQADGEYTVLTSNLDGTFDLHGPFTTGVLVPNTIVAQSFNSVTDDFYDVFVLGGANYCGDPGDGTGQLDDSCPAPGVIAAANIVRAVTTRFDGGATWDIALVEDMSDRVLFLPGNGGAGFQQIAANVGVDPSDVFAIDVDGNDVSDAVVAHRGGDTVGIVPFDGVLFDGVIEFPTGMGPSGIKAADLDGDGIVDVVTSNAAGDDMSVLLSDP
jgi:hypothetical protein